MKPCSGLALQWLIYSLRVGATLWAQHWLLWLDIGSRGSQIILGELEALRSLPSWLCGTPLLVNPHFVLGDLLGYRIYPSLQVAVE